MSKKGTLNVMPLVLVLLGVILVFVAGVIGLNIPKEPQASTPTKIKWDETSLPRVSLADAKLAFDDHAAVFVDVRSAEAYAQAHIPGALSIPLAELPERTEELDRQQWIITY